VNKKMSKQEILRGAIRYIRVLEYLMGLRDLPGLATK
jgi:hypothetical protein